METKDRFGPVASIAGVDAGIIRGTSRIRAAVVVLSFPDLEVVDQSIADRSVEFPYVPGLLSFREVPAILQAIEGLSVRPDVILCDGQGYAHPRRFGLACHLGIVTDTAAIGVAKSRLIGEHDEPGEERGAWSALIHDQEVIGAVLRTRRRVRPVYVSIGHRVSLDTAIDLVLRAAPRYRLPETTRHADRLASGR